VLCAAVCGVLWAYYWRVFFGLDNRVSPLVVTLGCAAFLEVCLLAGYCVRRFAKGFAAKGAVCIFLCGLLFAFANPPLQTPDEADHYLRTYAISTGHFDFDASRTYPDDVAYLLEAFPGAWVNAHTSAGVGTDPDTGAEKAYNTAGYALKQYGKDGAVQSMADSFALYLAHDVRDSVPDPVSEPVSFLVIPFLPGAVGMALARLLGFGALGCLYGGRIVNIHPSLLPAFKGAHAIRDAFEYGVKVYGVTVHYVNDELDGGKIIAQRAFDYTGADVQELEAMVHAVEHPLYVEAIAGLLAGRNR